MDLENLNHQNDNINSTLRNEVLFLYEKIYKEYSKI